MSTHWMALFAAAAFEIGWVSLFKMVSLDRPAVTAIALMSLVASMYLLWFAMKQIPLGVAYTVWTGIGALGAMTIGILFYGEAATLQRLVFAALIIGGVVGLKASA